MGSHSFTTPTPPAPSIAKFASQDTILIIASSVLTFISAAKKYIMQFQRPPTDQQPKYFSVQDQLSNSQNTPKSWRRKQPIWCQHQIISRRHIPIHCRQHYILWLSNASKGHLLKVCRINCGSDETITCSIALMTVSNGAHEKNCIETNKRMNMSLNSKIVQNLIKKNLDDAPKLSKASANVTPNKAANQLLLKIQLQTSEIENQTPNADPKHQLSQTIYHERIEKWYKYHEEQESRWI